MPKNKSTANVDIDDAAHDVPDTPTDVGNGAVIPPPPNAPTTPAVRALWPVLIARTGSTTAELAEAAKVSRSAAAKALAALEGASLVRRIPGGRKGARLFPDRWEHMGPAKEVPAESDGVAEAATTGDSGADPADEVATLEGPTEPDEAPAAEAGHIEQTDASQVSSESARLRPGALREMVIEYLRERPGEDFTPTALGKALERSSGAIANALDKLVSDATVTRTSDKPRRYRLTGQSG
jgi:DNA-binding MarR family transcriptional regulator